MRDPEMLSRCLVDSDPAANTRSRRRRQKALIIAVILEALVLAALLLAPLISSRGMPRRFIFTLAPPYSGGHTAKGTPPSSHPSSGHHSAAHNLLPVPLYQPPNIPNHVSSAGKEAETYPTDISDRVGIGQGERDSPGVPGGTGNGNGMPPPPQPTVEKPSPQPVKRISGTIEQAVILRRVDPVYPPILRQMGLQGTVRLHAVIGMDGSIHELAAESGHPLFVKAALDAVQQWRYKPTLLNGEPVEVETTITVIFEMSR